MEDIYTHDEAAIILEAFEELLSNYGIKIPSPEDDDREEDNEAVLYGSIYDELLSTIEDRLINILAKHTPGTEIITDTFSGTI